MKKTIIAITTAVTMSLSVSAFGWGLSWESGSAMGRDTIDPAAYNVEVSGNNLRVYEWITATQPYQKCVFVASEHNTQLDCDLIDEEDVPVE